MHLVNHLYLAVLFEAAFYKDFSSFALDFALYLFCHSLKELH
jgi:hypothetical protein